MKNKTNNTNKKLGRMNKILIICTVLVLLLLTLLVTLIINSGAKSDTVKIGFVLSGGMNEAGWNGKHYAGARIACEKLGAELIVKENVKEYTGDCNKAIEELADEGVGMIVLSSYNYADEAKELVKNYPEIVFYVNSSEYHDVNMTSYFARMYQARYLSGIVAGMKTKTNKVGYVAAMSNNEVNRGINAFTLGVKRVNPDASVEVAWTGDWDNADNEKNMAEYLIKDGVDVLTYHQNMPNVIETADKAGVYSIAYHEALSGYSPKYLTSVICKWELVYEEVFRKFIIGKGNVQDNYWIGMEADAVGLSEFSEEVTEDIRTEIEIAKNEFLSGKDVFSGVIYDNHGNLRCDSKETISDEILLEKFDWFVEGVEFYEE